MNGLTQAEINAIEDINDFVERFVKPRYKLTEEQLRKVYANL